MIAKLAASTSPLYLVIAGLIIFWFIFLGIVMWTFRRGARQKYDAASRIPLDQEENTK